MPDASADEISTHPHTADPRREVPVAGLPASPAGAYAAAFLGALFRLGVRHLVVCPGSRSQALALAAAALGRGGAHLHVRIDERDAAFFALGVGIESGRPAVVVTTSGTAAAELHAAVLEAHHAYVPLIVVTADRPAELHGVRANQTTTQTGLYGGALRLEEHVAAPVGAADEGVRAAAVAERALRAALGEATGTPGPVHVNVAFRAPLSGRASAAAAEERPGDETAGAAAPAVVVAGRRPLTLGLGPRTVVVAGSGAGPDAEELAHEAGWPLLAEVVSGARYGRELVVAYRELLREPSFGGRVERVVVFGHPTLSREVPELLARPDVSVVVVAPHGDDVVGAGVPDARRPTVASAVRVDDTAAGQRDRAWLRQWVTGSRRLVASAGGGGEAPDVARSRSSDPRERAAFARAELAAVREPVTRRLLVETVWQFTWPYDRLILGASRLIREADRVVPGKKISVYANRGLSGIDGTIATAQGVAAAASDGSQAHTGVTRVLLGDLALLHDAGALLFGSAERRPVMQVIVGNDHGGTIFEGLEVARTASPADFDRVLRTPQDVDLASLAKAYGWEYASAGTYGELERALSGQRAVPRLIEVPLGG
ncbi:MAG TPA: 2-succinyl-5-enolpyruvyl-6-hydroxy-3-cyclohexene-1-carboxylic-acid synthase [Microbacteriaceae bacterium]|nr:2-succinyl-5-enolpyruvyl-6-hydroxy-3-cyclohexene-1-carboxylic-acid synthase [Microbacteriaceae bacterium]